MYSQARLLHTVCALCPPCPHPAAVCAGVRERLDSMMCSMRTLQRGSRTASDLWAQQRRLRARTGMMQPALSLRSARHRTRRDFLSQSKSAEDLPAVPGLIRTGSLSRKDASRVLKSPWKFDPEGLGPKRQGGFRFRSCRVCYLARVQGHARPLSWNAGPEVRILTTVMCLGGLYLGAFTRQAQGARAASKHQGSRSDAHRPMTRSRPATQTAACHDVNRTSMGLLCAKRLNANPGIFGA